jgi:hypothetical protein
MPTATLNAPRSLVGPNPSPRAAALDRLGAAERLARYRAGEFSRAELVLWTARYPEEVPIVNGEVEWIALALADLD